MDQIETGGSTRTAIEYQVVWQGGYCLSTFNPAEAIDYINRAVDMRGLDRDDYEILSRRVTTTTTDWDVWQR